jgi:anti-anti-sigma factor
MAEINSYNVNDYVMIEINGKIDGSSRGKSRLAEIIRENIDQGMYNIALNLENAGGIDSYIIGTIASEAKILEEKGGIMALIRKISGPFDVLKMSGIDKLNSVKCYNSLSDFRKNRCNN